MTHSKIRLNTGFAHSERSLFGRRLGRALSKTRSQALEEILPKVSLPEDRLTLDHSTNPSSFFEKKYRKYWLEIGFGQGEHIAELFRANLDTGYIGAEPFLNGMSTFLCEIKYDVHDNLRVLMDDGMLVARSITSNSLDGIYILNPDPWHKKRHHKRRIICQKNLDIFARVLKPNAPLIMTTDVEDLAQWMCMHGSNHPEFEWSAKGKRDWYVPPKDWITTRYETKGAKNAKKMIYLFFKKGK